MTRIRAMEGTKACFKLTPRGQPGRPLFIIPQSIMAAFASDPNAADALSVNFGGRAGSLFLFVGNTCTRDLFGYKPDLKLVRSKNIADQQVIGSRSEEHTSELQSPM